MPDKPVTPSVVAQELTDHLEFLQEVIDERGGDLSLLGIVCEELSTHYRALGICLLSEKADLDGFFHSLIQSGLTRRHYLQGTGSTKGTTDPRHRRASFVDPLLDAMAAGQWRLAKEIAALVPQEWTKGEEYEEDFCYSHFLRKALTEVSEGMEGLLGQWREALEGEPDHRLSIAASVLAGDAPGFAENLTLYLDGREERARALSDPVSGSLLAEEATFFPNRWVSVEGLALLAVAEKRGMALPQQFPACPSLVRSRKVGPFRAKGFPNIAFEVE